MDEQTVARLIVYGLAAFAVAGVLLVGYLAHRRGLGILRPVEELLDVVEVVVKDDYVLHLVFENGERRVFDMSPYMEKCPFSRLKDSPLFKLATVDYGTVVWPGEIDIAPETLYYRSKPVLP